MGHGISWRGQIKDTREKTRKLFEEARQASNDEEPKSKLKESRVAGRVHRFGLVWFGLFGLFRLIGLVGLFGLVWLVFAWFRIGKPTKIKENRKQINEQ